MTFGQSRDSGPHRTLADLVGSWAGVSKTWFQPDVLADESAVGGTIELVAGDRFALYRYDAVLQDEPLAGVALFGYHLDAGDYTCAWVDSFHTGTDQMILTGAAIDGGFQVTGSYPAGDGPPWGWRIEVTRPANDRLLIAMFNITPERQEARAVEMDLTRTG
jgi:hypothetical protein